MTNQQKLVLVVSILASFVSFLDGSVVTVALPAITQELGGGLVVQQWVVDAYLITLGALMLIAGSLSDLFGRRRVLVAGLLGFGVTSILCAIAWNSTFLIISRALQGVAGALLVPSSLALIISAFKGPAQGKAIGTWTGWTGVAFILGPLAGGLLVDTTSWRFIFAMNVIPILVTWWLLRKLRNLEAPKEHARLDVTGAIFGAIGLGGPVYALIEQAHYGWSSPLIYIPLIVGVVALVAFLFHERRTATPMLPVELFRSRNFAIGNLATVAIYAGLTISTFLITIFVQQVGEYTAVESGLALLPVTIIMFVLSPRFGALASTYGSRWFMTFGPVIAGVGFLLLLLVDERVDYWTQVFPGIIAFGVGLSVTVAPLTSAVLGAIEARHAGIASAVNNAIARVAGLVAIAAIGIVLGSTLDVTGFHRGAFVMAGLLFVGGIISAIGITNSQVKQEHST